MLNFLSKHKDRIIHELGSWISLFFSFMVGDGYHVLLSLYNGDYSDATILGLRFIIIQSIVKTILIHMFPQLFPLYQKGKGILPPSPSKTEKNTSPQIDAPRDEI